MQAETHLLGSRDGYRTIAKSKGIRADEEGDLTVLSFGQAETSDMPQLTRAVVGHGRLLPSGRYALTRYLPGPPDDVGRPTIQLRTLVMDRDVFNKCIRGQLKSFMEDLSFWKQRAFETGGTIGLPKASAPQTPIASDYVLFDGWDAGAKKSVVTVVEGGASAAPLIMHMVSAADVNDASSIRWGTNILSCDIDVDLCTMLPGRQPAGRRRIEQLRPSGPLRSPAIAQLRDAGKPPARRQVQPASIQPALSQTGLPISRAIPLEGIAALGAGRVATAPASAPSSRWKWFALAGGGVFAVLLVGVVTTVIWLVANLYSSETPPTLASGDKTPSTDQPSPGEGADTVEPPGHGTEDLDEGQDDQTGKAADVVANAGEQKGAISSEEQEEATQTNKLDPTSQAQGNPKPPANSGDSEEGAGPLQGKIRQLQREIEDRVANIQDEDNPTSVDVSEMKNGIIAKAKEVGFHIDPSELPRDVIAKCGEIADKSEEVDEQDLFVFLDKNNPTWKQTIPRSTPEEYDVNNDGKIDHLDVVTICLAFGKVPGPNPQQGTSGASNAEEEREDPPPPLKPTEEQVEVINFLELTLGRLRVVNEESRSVLKTVTELNFIGKWEDIKDGHPELGKSYPTLKELQDHFGWWNKFSQDAKTREIENQRKIKFHKGQRFNAAVATLCEDLKTTFSADWSKKATRVYSQCGPFKDNGTRFYFGKAQKELTERADLLGIDGDADSMGVKRIRTLLEDCQKVVEELEGTQEELLDNLRTINSEIFDNGKTWELWSPDGSHWECSLEICWERSENRAMKNTKPRITGLLKILEKDNNFDKYLSKCLASIKGHLSSLPQPSP